MERIACHGRSVSEVEHTLGDFHLSVERRAGDAEPVLRIVVHGEGARLELAPSKALALIALSFDGDEVFWDPPFSSLPDPATVDLRRAVAIHGAPVPGSEWLRWFGGGIELLGLDHWGMFDGAERPLHGNVTLIPVETIEVEKQGGAIAIVGVLEVADPLAVIPPLDAPRYYRVVRRVTLDPAARAVHLTDTITNISTTARTPDWGYHIQFRPEPVCRFEVPADEVYPRRKRGSGEAVDLRWRPARDPAVREERGYVHRGVRYDAAFPDGTPACGARLTYPGGAAVECLLPPAPYVLAWFSCGGAHDPAFAEPDSHPPQPLFDRPWDGVGPEIGASDLDHGSDGDPAVNATTLEPGESLTLQILVRRLRATE